jgi:hypothetical protein
VEPTARPLVAAVGLYRGKRVPETSGNLSACAPSG